MIARMEGGLLGVWTLAHSGMLLWGLAAAVPIVLHLFSWRRHRELPWGAMQFLLAAMRRHSRRLYLEQWLLVLLRVLALLLLAAALADPANEASVGSGGLGFATGRTHHVLVFDASYSMLTRDADGTRFERAVRQAQELLRSAPEGDGFSLIFMANPPERPTREPVYNRQQIQEWLAACEVSHQGAELGPALDEILQASEKTPESRHSHLLATRVHFFTDLAVSTWAAVRTSENRERWRQLTGCATLVMHDVGAASTGSQSINVAITRLEARETPVGQSREMVFDVDVQRFGTTPAPQRRLELWVDGQLAHTAVLDLAANAQITHSLAHRFLGPGQHLLEARLASDSLLLDNHRWLVVPLRDRVRVLIVEGTPDAGKHLALALAPGEAGTSVIDAQRIADSALLDTDFSGIDAVFLSNVARFGLHEAQILRDYVAAGGGLVFFLGDQVDAENYNRMLGDSPGARPLLPVTVGSTRSERSYALDPLGYRHRIVSSFRGFERSGLLTTPTWKYFVLKPVEMGQTRTVLAFDTNDPALVEWSADRGAVLVMATAADMESTDSTTVPPRPWSGLATWPSFPPLLHEMLAWLLHREIRPRTVIVGEPLVASALPGSGTEPLTVVDPQGKEQVVRIREGVGPASWSFSDTRWSGVYHVHGAGPTSDEDLRYAANVDCEESDPRRIELESLALPFETSDASLPAEISARSAIPRRSWFRVLLGAVLGLVMADVVLGYLFARSP